MSANDMRLPAGRTCSDCISFQRCTSFIGDVAKNTSCDWAPSRFRDSISQAARDELTSLRDGLAGLLDAWDRSADRPDWDEVFEAAVERAERALGRKAGEAGTHG